MESTKDTEKNSRKFKLTGKFSLITLLLILYDFLVINLSYFVALWIRFDCRYSAIETKYLHACICFVPVYALVSIVIFWFLKLYQSIWRFASYQELMRGIVATVCTAILHILGITVIFGRMPITYYILGILIQFVLVIGIRFSYRFILLERTKRESKYGKNRGKNIMLIGAGAAGRLILRDIQTAKETNNRVCCIIDDNPSKWD